MIEVSEDMSRKELAEVAENLGLSVKARDTKADLIEAIEAAGSADPKSDDDQPKENASQKSEPKPKKANSGLPNLRKFDKFK